MQGSALAAMVGQLTYGKRIWESLDTPMRKLIPVLDQASKDMVCLHLLIVVVYFFKDWVCLHLLLAVYLLL